MKYPKLRHLAGYKVVEEYQKKAQATDQQPEQASTPSMGERPRNQKFQGPSGRWFITTQIADEAGRPTGRWHTHPTDPPNKPAEVSKTKQPKSVDNPKVGASRSEKKANKRKVVDAKKMEEGLKLMRAETLTDEKVNQVASLLGDMKMEELEKLHQQVALAPVHRKPELVEAISEKLKADGVKEDRAYQEDPKPGHLKQLEKINEKMFADPNHPLNTFKKQVSEFKASNGTTVMTVVSDAKKEMTADDNRQMESYHAVKAAIYELENNKAKSQAHAEAAKRHANSAAYKEQQQPSSPKEAKPPEAQKPPEPPKEEKERPIDKVFKKLKKELPPPIPQKPKRDFEPAAKGMVPSRLKGSSNFVAMKTREEQSEHLKGLGVKEVKISEDPYAINYGNRVCQALQALKALGHPMPHRVIVNYSLFEKDGHPGASGMSSQISPGVYEIGINYQAAQRQGFDSQQELFDYAHKKGFFASNDNLMAVVHEMGHNYHRVLTGGGPLNSTQRHKDFLMGVWEMKPEELSQVSDYGRSDLQEFVAETYSGHMLGIEYAPSIIALYKKLGGGGL